MSYYLPISLSAGKGDCVIDKARRNWCPYCRLRMCFMAQMNVKAVQEERGPRKRKTSANTINRKSTKASVQPQHHPQSLLHQLAEGNEHRYRILVQILISCTKCTRENIHFQLLDKSQQKVILRATWFECFLLRAGCWTLDVLPIMEICKDPVLTSTISQIQSLRLDLTELCLMETLILCRKELATNEDNMKQLEAINERSLLALGRYSLYKALSWTRYGKLLVALRSLSDHLQLTNSLIYKLYRNVVSGME